MQKGLIHLPLLVLLVILIVFGIFFTVKQAAKSPQNSYSFRFNTLAGGEFDVKYPSSYFAAQDYETKAVSFKLSGCQINCQSLVIAKPSNEATTSGKIIKIGDKEYYQIKDQPLTFYPKWTNKLGFIEINGSLSDSSSQIISSLNFVKEIPIISPSSTVTPSPKPINQTLPTTNQLDDFITDPNKQILRYMNPILGQKDFSNIIAENNNNLVGIGKRREYLPINQDPRGMSSQLYLALQAIRAKHKDQQLDYFYAFSIETGQLVIVDTTDKKQNIAYLVNQDNTLKIVPLNWGANQLDCGYPVSFTKDNVFVLACMSATPQGGYDYTKVFKIDFNQQSILKVY